MKIAFISDTHGKHQQLDLPEADLLIHAGDISGRGLKWQVREFIDWFAQLPHRHKVFIGGNHDFLLEEDPETFRSLMKKGIIYLENSGVEIEGLQIWGSPITPWFHDWAFNRQRGEVIREYWEAIPETTDILVTHGPPRGKGDRTSQGEQVGCSDLLEIVKKIKPRYHVFGHIHEDHGIVEGESTTFINASVLNLSYEMARPPVIVEW